MWRMLNIIHISLTGGLCPCQTRLLCWPQKVGQQAGTDAWPPWARLREHSFSMLSPASPFVQRHQKGQQAAPGSWIPGVLPAVGGSGTALQGGSPTLRISWLPFILTKWNNTLQTQINKWFHQRGCLKPSSLSACPRVKEQKTAKSLLTVPPLFQSRLWCFFSVSEFLVLKKEHL